MRVPGRPPAADQLVELGDPEQHAERVTLRRHPSFRERPTDLRAGLVGLGRMGSNIVRRLMRDGHECVVFDVKPDAVAALAQEGALGTGSIRMG